MCVTSGTREGAWQPYGVTYKLCVDQPWVYRKSCIFLTLQSQVLGQDITRTSRFFFRHCPLASTLMHMTLSPSFVFAFCNQSKIGGGNSQGTRLQYYWDVLEIVPGIDHWDILEIVLRWSFLKTWVYIPVIALRSKHHDMVMKTRNDPPSTNSSFLLCLAFHITPVCSVDQKDNRDWALYSTLTLILSWSCLHSCWHVISSYSHIFWCFVPFWLQSL